MRQVTPMVLMEHLRRDLKHGAYPVYIWGAPGVGKSTIVNDVGKELGLEVVCLSVALEHPYTLGGLPVVLWKERQVEKLPPSYIKRLKEGILFLDDFAASDPAQQRVALTLTTYRRVGDFPLPPGVRVVFASNRIEDSSHVIRPSMAVLNRVKHYLLVPSLVDFAQYLLGHSATDVTVYPWGEKVHSVLADLLIAFLRVQPKYFFMQPSQVDSGVVYPTPRSWFNALVDLSWAMAEWGTDVPIRGKETDIEIILAGWVGEAAAKFLPFLTWDVRDAAEQCLKSPSFIKSLAIPQQIALVLYLASQHPSSITGLVKHLDAEVAAFIAHLVRESDLGGQEKAALVVKAFTKTKKEGKKHAND